MGERIVKFRLVTYFDEVPNQVTPQGENVLVERVASLGQTVDLRDADEERLDSLGALYSEEEQEQIEDGTYKGPDSALLAQAQAGLAPVSQIEPADGEHGDIEEMSVDELADYITDNELNVDQTVALAGDDVDSINKVLDAESLATDNEPRKGVVTKLEAKLNAASGGGT